MVVEARFDFEQFIERISALSHADMVTETERESAAFEALLWPGRGRRGLSGEPRDYAAPSYRRLSRLLFFIRFGRKPTGASSHEISQYRLLADSLLQRGMYRPMAMAEIESWLHEASGPD
jgi:hypothetical protein